MNVERLESIRDYLLHPPENYEFGFNMGGWAMTQTDDQPDQLDNGDSNNYCGTVYCIAGLACAMYPKVSDYADYERQATSILDLEPNQASRLFFGGDNVMEDITVNMAIHAINTLIETGRADWQDDE